MHYYVRVRALIPTSELMERPATNRLPWLRFYVVHVYPDDGASNFYGIVPKRKDRRSEGERVLRAIRPHGKNWEMMRSPIRSDLCMYMCNEVWGGKTAA